MVEMKLGVWEIDLGCIHFSLHPLMLSMTVGDTGEDCEPW
jgi:hypothetical protein